jgi:hypothetical protein
LDGGGSALNFFSVNTGSFNGVLLDTNTLRKEIRMVVGELTFQVLGCLNSSHFRERRGYM